VRVQSRSFVVLAIINKWLGSLPCASAAAVFKTRQSDPRAMNLEWLKGDVDTSETVYTSTTQK
jgi:hypothetical protein